MSSQSPKCTVSRRGGYISAQQIADYRQLMNEQGLTMPPEMRCLQADGSIVLKTHPGRVCLWDTQAEAQRFADKLSSRSRVTWDVMIDPAEATAHHEASHAVAAIALGRPIGATSICGGEGYWGTHHLPGLGAAGGDPVAKEREIIIRLAGYAGQARHEQRAGFAVPNIVELAAGQPNTDPGFLMDGRDAYQIADQITVDVAAAVRCLAAVTQALVDDASVGRAIEAVADGLLNSLTGGLEAIDIKQVVATAGLVPQTPSVRWTPTHLHKA